MESRRSFIQASLGAAALASASCHRRPSAWDTIDRQFGRLAGKGAVLAAEVVVYGATPAGIIAAVEAATHRRSVLLIGGWRERHLGGMMSGGLGWTDVSEFAVVGGRAREAIRAISGKSRVDLNPYAFEPPRAEAFFQDLIRSAGVPVYWCEGVAQVRKDGWNIAEFETYDGMRARGRVFIDASYEGDLMAAAGVSYKSGREKADSYNKLNGYRGLEPGDGGNNHQFALKGRLVRVDPFMTPGDPSSGLIRGVKPQPSLGVGAADQATQAYTFRLTMTKEAQKRVDLPAAAPAGYDRADFEGLFRYLASLQALGLVHGRDWTFEDNLISASKIGSVYDINARGGFSTDPFGLSWGYPDAGHAARETIWKAHETYLRGFFYALSWDQDPRVPATLRHEVKQWGLAKGFYDNPIANDAPGWPYQLYVREARRLVGDTIWTGADLRRDENQPPRDPRIIAVATYREDSHHVQRLAVKSGQAWSLWNEGNIEADYGKHNHAPLPYGLIVPNRGDCTNLIVPFCVSATHQAFSAIRTEPTAMALGQASGAAAVIVCQSRDPLAVQDVPYAVLSKRLRNSSAVLGPPDFFTEFLNRVQQKADILLNL